MNLIAGTFYQTYLNSQIVLLFSSAISGANPLKLLAAVHLMKFGESYEAPAMLARLSWPSQRKVKKSMQSTALSDASMLPALSMASKGDNCQFAR